MASLRALLEPIMLLLCVALCVSVDERPDQASGTPIVGSGEGTLSAPLGMITGDSQSNTKVRAKLEKVEQKARGLQRLLRTARRRPSDLGSANEISNVGQANWRKRKILHRRRPNRRSPTRRRRSPTRRHWRKRRILHRRRPTRRSPTRRRRWPTRRHWRKRKILHRRRPTTRSPTRSPTNGPTADPRCKVAFNEDVTKMATRLGCFRDNSLQPEFDSAGIKYGPGMSPQSRWNGATGTPTSFFSSSLCVKACAESGFRYAAITTTEASHPQYPYVFGGMSPVCSCGHNYGSYGEVVGDRCDRPCTAEDVKFITTEIPTRKIWNGSAQVQVSTVEKGLVQKSDLAAKRDLLQCAIPCFRGWMCTLPKGSAQCKGAVYPYNPRESFGGKGLYVDFSFPKEPGAAHTCGTMASWDQGRMGIKGDYFNVVYDLNKQIPWERTSIVNETKAYKVTGCLGKQAKLSCPKGEHIVVESGFMGRHSGSSFCASCSATSTSCSGKSENNVTDLVSTACKDSQMCIILVGRSSLSFTACPSLTQALYLQVKYSCVPFMKAKTPSTQAQAKANSVKLFTASEVPASMITTFHSTSGSGSLAKEGQCPPNFVLYKPPKEPAECKPAPFECTTDGVKLKEMTSPIFTSECLCLIKKETSNVIVNRCVSNGKPEQVHLVECRALGQSEGCNAAFDANLRTSVKIPLKGSMKIQFPIATRVREVRIFYPPTASGGTMTQPQNIFGFKFQCHIDGDTTSDSKWLTLLDTTGNPKDKRFNGKPGVKTFEVSKECSRPSSTFRFHNMSLADLNLKDPGYIEIVDIAFRKHADLRKAKPLLFPKFSGGYMTVVEDRGGFDIRATLTSGFEGQQCVNTVVHGALKEPVCSRVSDGDTSTAVIFNTNPHCEDPVHGDCAPSLVTELAQPAKYSSVWMYYHPSNVAVGTQLKRFNVLCWKSEAWQSILDADSAHGKPQFTAVKDNTGWVHFIFERACVSRKFKVTNLDPERHGHSYIFELKYSTSNEKLHMCSEALTGTGRVQNCLAGRSGNKIQGWCMSHQIVEAKTTIGNRHLPAALRKAGGGWRGRKAATWKYGIQKRNALLAAEIDISEFIQDQKTNTTLPSSSAFAIEVIPEEEIVTKGQGSSYVNTPFWFALQSTTGKDFSLGDFRTNCGLKKKQRKKATTCKHVPANVVQVDLTTFRQHQKVNLKCFGKQYSFASYAYWQFKKKMKIIYWWQPPFDFDCRVPFNKVQAQTTPAVKMP